MNWLFIVKHSVEHSFVFSWQTLEGTYNGVLESLTRSLMF